MLLFYAAIAICDDFAGYNAHSGKFRIAEGTRKSGFFKGNFVSDTCVSGDVDAVFFWDSQFIHLIFWFRPRMIP